MKSEFERENRYIVLKRKHLANLPSSLQHRLKPALDEAAQLMPKFECVVIESDWPEYEPAWEMIEARMTGAPVTPDYETLNIEGITYSRELFRQLGGLLPLGKTFRLVGRSRGLESGTLTIETVEGPQADAQPEHYKPTVPKFKFDTLVEHCKRLERDLAESRAHVNQITLYQENAVWFWQHDGQDFLDSLSCPIIIQPHHLREIIAGNAAEPAAPDIEAAAQKLAKCMDYPWSHMPELGREGLREHAKAILSAALSTAAKPGVQS